ncbi:hypothetical protein MMC06_006278 [Schaereria dolodes]|nr:hypothetical protein [Schaereria dolodes]
MSTVVSGGPRPLWLLVLPQPPFRVSLPTLRAAFGEGLSQVLHKASGENAQLDVAIFNPELSAHDDIPRTVSYLDSQHLVGNLYKLICIICAEASIDLQHDNDVDTRIVILGQILNKGPVDNDRDTGSLLEGPIIDLNTLALSSRAWTNICFIDSEDGESLRHTFLSQRNAAPLRVRSLEFSLERVAGGITTGLPKPHHSAAKRLQNRSDRLHYSVAVGGTFDHLHAGHKLLLTATAFILEPYRSSSPTIERVLTIGITGDELLKNKKYAEFMESWEARQDAILQFLLSILSFEKLETAICKSERLATDGPNGNAIHYELHSGLIIKCVEISDPFGPTITDSSISALVISGETRAGGKAINDRRVEKDWPALEVYEVDVLDSQVEDETKSDRRQSNYQDKISSTDIRRKIHDRASI